MAKTEDNNGQLKPGKYAYQKPKAIEHVDVANKREPRPIKTKTIQLKKLR